MKKRRSNKKKTGVKGIPSAVLLSILIHVGLFLLAGTLVVFTVVKKEAPKFVPPKAVERPKMKLRKPKVKVKKSAKPNPTTRIVTKVKRASMPDIQLPEMSSMTAEIGGGIGGFDMMPDLGEVTVFGGGQTIGNDFVGVLYDFKRTRRGGVTGIDYEGFLTELAKFTRGDWRTDRLAKYYQAPRKLYTTHFMIPTLASAIAPTAFGEPDMVGYAWCVYYKGQIVHPVGGRFRFWAQGDDVIIVRVNGKIVVDGSVSDAGFGNFRSILSNYVNVDADSMKYFMGERRAEVGKWFTLESGVPQEMEVLIGESPGGSFAAMLAVQEEGVEYPESPQGGPLLPMFKTAEPTHDVLDTIYECLVAGEVCLTNGPIFCDYGTGYSETERLAEAEAALATAPAPEPTPVEETLLRAWTTTDGKSVKGEYISTIGDKVVLKTSKHRTIKIPRRNLSPEDREFIELSDPPKFKLDFRALSRQRHINTLDGSGDIPEALQWRFGARIKKVGTGEYNQELQIEYFAIGQQLIDRNKFILLDRGNDRFTPSRENNYAHEFINENVIELMEYIVSDQKQGRKKYGYLMVVRDPRGEIIEHQSSSKWLWENFSNLEKLPVGAFMDKTCNRVYPSGPKATRY